MFIIIIKLVLVVLNLIKLLDGEPLCYNYRVQPGDGLWSLYNKFNTTSERIKEDNPGIDFDKLNFGNN